MRDLPLPTLPMADLSSHLSAESRAARRSLHPRSAPEASTRPGIEVVWARTAQDVLAAQRLRYDIFAVEMGARLSVPVGSPAGHDIDLFDPYCEHLLVRLDTGTNEPGQVIGTYRVLTPPPRPSVGGLYSETEFDLTRLRPLRGKHGRAGPLLRAPGPPPRRRHHGPVGRPGRVHACATTWTP
jgi:putative hemolysin